MKNNRRMCTVCVVFLFLSPFTPFVLGHIENIRIGLSFPKNVPDNVKQMMGYKNSAGAFAVASDKIKRDQVLPGFNWRQPNELQTFDIVIKNITARFSVITHFDDCNTAAAANIALEMLTRQNVDVLFMPPCYNSALVMAQFGTYYDTPMITWTPMSADLHTLNRFPLMATVLPSPSKVATVLKTMLLHFNWRHIALMHSEDGNVKNCNSVINNFRDILEPNEINIVLDVSIDNDDNVESDIDTFLMAFKNLSRIAIICLENESHLAKFMLRALNLGLMTESYVYIVSDCFRHENGYLDKINDNQPKNFDDKLAETFKYAFFIEMQMVDINQLNHFKHEVARRIKDFPFSEEHSEPTGSMFSPFLHDAIYLYAIALNRTIQQGGTVRNAYRIIQNSKETNFFGASGHVIIDEFGEREPVFSIQIYNPRRRSLDSIATAFTTFDQLVPEMMFWTNRNGFVPQDFIVKPSPTVSNSISPPEITTVSNPSTRTTTKPFLYISNTESSLVSNSFSRKDIFYCIQFTILLSVFVQNLL